MAFWDSIKEWKKKIFSIEPVAVGKSVPSSKENSAAEAEAYDEVFMAEHFEGLGDIWFALFGDDATMMSHLPTVLQQGKVLEHCRVLSKNNALVALLQYPEVGDIRIGALVVKMPDSDKLHFLSCFPIMQGLPNHLKIRKSHTWANGAEGVVAAEQAAGGAPVSFFAPFYFRDRAGFTPDSERSINLAALAFSCEKAESQEYTVDEGPFYEIQLEKFLKENPDKTALDFPKAVVSMSGSRVMFPRTYACEWDYRCPVLAVEQTTFFDQLIYKLHVLFVGMDEDELAGFLYVPEHMLNGYIPQAGDDIQGGLWMTGYLGDE